MAEIRFNGKTPISVEFDDVYYSPENGLDETRQIYLRGNNLEDRFKAVRRSFHVGELGFGTGLNFLATWELWSRTAPPHAKLYFTSCEKFPLSKEQLQQTLEPWSDLSHFKRQLVERYPERIRGWHRVEFEGGRVVLTLQWGDVAEVWSQLKCREPSSGWKVNAWYLDGFTPSKNPEMWRDSVFETLREKSAPGATLASFSVAGSVRRGLLEAGFKIEKAQGFGKKRESLIGKLGDEEERDQSIGEVERRVAFVIGGGIAGVQAAAALVRRGWRVKIFEAASALAAGGSGNPQGIVAPLITQTPGNVGRFSASAFSYWLRNVAVLRTGQSFLKTGLFLQAYSADKIERYRSAVVEYPLPREWAFELNAPEVEEFLGVPSLDPGLWIPSAGVVCPKEWIQKELEWMGERISIELEQPVARIERDRGGSWSVVGLMGQRFDGADAVILAASVGVLEFEQARAIPLRKLWGQISEWPTDSRCDSMKAVLNYEGYLTPARSGVHVGGATHERVLDENRTIPLRMLKGSREILDQLRVRNSALCQNWNATERGRVSVRATLADSLPAVGRLPILERTEEKFRDLHHGRMGRESRIDPLHEALDCPDLFYPNLYVMTGMGARGLSQAPLCAEVLAAQIQADFGFSEPGCVEADLVDQLSPMRFLIRSLKRPPQNSD